MRGDVATGNGNASFGAARRLTSVTSTDYVPELLDKGDARARAEGLAIAFQVADCEDLSFSDGSFVSCSRPSGRCSPPTISAPPTR